MSVAAGGAATGVVLRQHTGLTESEDQPGRTPVGGALMHSGERRNEAATRANVQGRLRDRLHGGARRGRGHRRREDLQGNAKLSTLRNHSCHFRDFPSRFRAKTEG